MNINTPHFNAIAEQFLTEAKMPCSAKQTKKKNKKSKPLKKLRKGK